MDRTASELAPHTVRLCWDLCSIGIGYYRLAHSRSSFSQENRSQDTHHVRQIAFTFIPSVRHLTAYVAGISRLDLRQFMMFAYPGAFIWSFTYLSLGHELGEKWFLVEGYGRYGVYLLLSLILITVTIFAFLKVRKTKATM